MEMLLAALLGFSLNWWYTPVPVPHVIEYKPKTELTKAYNPVDDCKESNEIRCSNKAPRIVMTQDGFGQLTDRLIDTRSELKQCVIKIEEHNKVPITYKGHFDD